MSIIFDKRFYVNPEDIIKWKIECLINRNGSRKWMYKNRYPKVLYNLSYDELESFKWKNFRTLIDLAYRSRVSNYLSDIGCDKIKRRSIKLRKYDDVY